AATPSTVKVCSCSLHADRTSGSAVVAKAAPRALRKPRRSNSPIVVPDSLECCFSSLLMGVKSPRGEGGSWGYVRLARRLGGLSRAGRSLRRLEQRVCLEGWPRFPEQLGVRAARGELGRNTLRVARNAQSVAPIKRRYRAARCARVTVPNLQT